MSAAERFTGYLVRDDEGFLLRADDGRRLRLTLPRVPVDAVEKRVTVTGQLCRDGTIDADGVAIGT